MQLDSMEAATFLGMRPTGWREFDARQFCIRLLSHQLSAEYLMQKRRRAA
jgi:hypothetical protein